MKGTKEMRKTMFMLLAAALLVVAGCKKDDKNANGGMMTFSAGFDKGGAKTEINGLAMSWNQGDAVMINGKEFTADGGGASITLSGEAVEKVGGLYKAYFPVSVYNGGTLTLPATQTYNGNNLSGVNPMYAQSGTTDLVFSNLCALVKIVLNGSDKTVTEIRVSADKPLSGEFEIAEGDGGYKAVLKSTTGTAGVTLDCGDGESLSGDKVFYVALPDDTYDLKFVAVASDGTMATIEKTGAELTANELRELAWTPSFQAPVKPSEVTVTAGCSIYNYNMGGSVTVPEGTHTCEFGLVYSESDDTPTIEEGAQKVVAGTATFSGTKDFSTDLTGLTVGTTYHVRAYAMIDGVTYSTDVKDIVGGDGPQPLPASWVNGKNPHPFTVSDNGTPANTDDDIRVYFSQGNLQYKATGSSATAASGEYVGGTWRFAEHQFDMVRTGDAHGTDVTGEYNYEYDGWIDLFGWGTSGYNHGAVCYQPWSTVNTTANYRAYGDANKNLYDSDGTADWGKAYTNTIQGGGSDNWRTLTGGSSGEWYYLINSRKNASDLYGLGKVGNCTPGLIILPDDWAGCPGGLSFTPGKSAYNNNVYSYSEWTLMEAEGAVFLPAAGQRLANMVYDTGVGFYWSSSSYNSDNAYQLYFFSEYVFVDGSEAYGRNRRGLSVRLVSDN